MADSRYSKTFPPFLKLGWSGFSLRRDAPSFAKGGLGWIY